MGLLSRLFKSKLERRQQEFVTDLALKHVTKQRRGIKAHNGDFATCRACLDAYANAMLKGFSREYRQPLPDFLKGK